MREPDFLLFASDATLLGLAGAGLLLLSVGTVLGDRRRARRKHVDAVGWVPWATLSVVTAFVGLSLLAMAAMGWLRG